MYDILIQNGRVIDPSQGLDDNKDIGLTGRQVTTIADTIPESEARQVIDAQGIVDPFVKTRNLKK